MEDCGGVVGEEESELTAAYRRHGDLGAVAGEVLPERDDQGLGVLEVERTFRQIAAARGPAAKATIVRDLLSRATPLEAKYIVKIMTGDLRIGLKESLVEEAIARAYGATLAEVQRANMLLGDIGETVRLASRGTLAEAEIRLFHPLGFMLASPIESAEEGLSYFAEAAVEDKYDGIRAQAHVSGGEVKFFSRTRDEITDSFPELPDALAGLPQDAILDGEIVAWEYPGDRSETQQVVDEAVSEASEQKAWSLGRARPFSVLQQRLGRKKVSDKMLRRDSGRVPDVRRVVCGRRVADGSSAAGTGAEFWMSCWRRREGFNHTGHGGSQRKGATQGSFAFDAEATGKGKSSPPALSARRYSTPRRLRNWKNFSPQRRSEATKG